MLNMRNWKTGIQSISRALWFLLVAVEELGGVLGLTLFLDAAMNCARMLDKAPSTAAWRVAEKMGLRAIVVELLFCTGAGIKWIGLVIYSCDYFGR
jgi:hypothetical protein